MNFRKHLIKLNNRLESSWKVMRFSESPVELIAGWYIAEFLVSGAVTHTPRMLVRNRKGDEVERALIGSHAGRNRMLLYLPEGELTAFSKSVEFERLARVSNIEGRARILLICFRYLLDFFSLRVFLKMLVMQFQDRFELSTDLLTFYEPAGGLDHYLHNIERWRKFRGFSKQLTWLGRGVRIAVLIEDDSQRAELNELLVTADYVINAGEALPDDVDYCIPLGRQEHLREPAILMLKLAIKRCRVKPDFIYTDHDYIAEDNTRIQHPVFKPSPSSAYLHCFNYVGFAVVLKSDEVKEVGTASVMNDQTKYQLTLRAFTAPAEILHISEALISSERSELLQTPAPLSRESAWPNILWQRRKDYNVLLADPAWATQPSVDLVIPTRDGLQVLKPCIDGILNNTAYSNFKVIVVDNGSELDETLNYFASITQDDRVSVVDYPGEFNYSAINNFAVSTGSSDYVALINNDIEVISRDWLTQMMAWATQPGVGIVGAKLLFGNGKVQHAGVTIGMGNAAGHIHRLEEGTAPGYQLRCLATQNMMAVTAACLITPRALFEKMKGLNEVDFKVAYNDIDYCLRVEASGKEVIWTPEAKLYHHESVSRGDDMSDQHVERYFRELETLQRRWKCKGFVDKYYSKHLRISDEGVFPQMERDQDDDLHYLS